MVDLAASQSLLENYIKAADDKQYAECRKMLDEQLTKFIEMPTFLNPEGESPTKEEEVNLVVKTMEQAVLVAATTKEIGEFRRHFEILRTYYNDFPTCKSDRRQLILGLHLLCLLASNETRTFHMELERIKVVDQESLYIKDVIQLERYLMEGSYHKMLQARKKVPSEHYTPLMDLMLLAVRRAVFQCTMSAYDKVSVTGACKLLMFDNQEELLKFIEQEKESKEEDESRGAWVLKNDHFLFNHEEGTVARKGALPFEQILENNLNYAHELYRIV
eukprot:TRINITY_DN2135_c0_g1_i1.p1 TRINITY_DN2135_c0_g1~~TRINITY_DN2135_c0_g1_i1.p1  ORF type:complete len:275 (+),score=45.41 TRINITY_DN2135_c0_g1_i1:45-869(+)